MKMQKFEDKKALLQIKNIVKLEITVFTQVNTEQYMYM